MKRNTILKEDYIINLRNYNLKKLQLNYNKMEDIYLEDLCRKCNKQQHIEMLRIVVENCMKFSENKNGVFINYSTLSPENQCLLKEYLQKLSL